MRVLIVGMHYAPEESGNAPYTTGFAEHLANRGHDVHVLAGLPHYPSWKAGKAKSATHNGVRVHRRWHFVPSSQSASGRALYEGTFLLSGTSLVGLPRPDAVVAIVPALSDGVLARVASKRFGVPYGVVFQDLMGLAAAESGVRGGRKVEQVVRAAEGWVARDAQSVGIIAEGFRSYLEGCGVGAQRINRLRNWNQIPMSAAERHETRARYGWGDDAFVCLHAGNMGHKQDLENIVDAARRAKEVDPDLRFVLAGDGNRRRELEALVNEGGISNVQFLPSLNSQDYADALAAADLLLLNQRPGMKNMAFPSKITSYVFAGTPILAAAEADSDTAVELAPAEAAHLVEPGKPEALLAAIRELKANGEMRSRLASAAAHHGRQHLTAEAALSQWEAFVTDVAGGGLRSRALLNEAA